MESFSIECTTCRARLKVRNEAAIGQILTCPKCSSMVLVERPSEHRADAEASPDPTESAGQSNSEAAVAMTAVAKESAPATIEPHDASLAPGDEPSSTPPPPTGSTPVHATPAHAESAAHADAAPPATEPNQSDSTGMLSDTVEDLSVYGTQRPPPPGEIPLPTVPDSLLSEQPLLPTEAWSSESSQRVRNWLMLGSAATIGIFIAVGVFALVAMRLARNGDDVAKSPGETQIPTAEQSGADPPLVTTAGNPDVGATVVDTNTVPVVNDSGDPDDPQRGDPQAPPAADGTGTNPPDEGPRADDPPDEDHPPGFVGPEDTPPGFVAADTDSTASADASLDKTLREFEALLDATPEAPTDDAPPSPAVPDLGIEDAGPKRPEPRVVNVAERLADTIEEIQFDGTSLNDFLRFVASFSTIPITLDPDAFLWLDVTPSTPVSAHQKAATVQMVLQTVVESVGLTTTVVDDQLLVTLPDEGMLAKPYAVSDLAKSEAELETLARLLPNLIARDSWQAGGGLGTVAVNEEGLTIQQSARVHRQVLRFLEKLRVARGLSPTSSSAAAKFELASRYARASKQLEKNITLNFFQPTSIDQVTDRLAKFAECLILIDWQSLHQAGWNSDTMVTLTVSETPLGKTLDDLLEPMGLGYRCVDSGLIQITTTAQLERESEFELYAITDLLEGGKAEPVIARLQAAVGPEWATARGGSVLEFDPASGTLLAAFPQPGQIALEKSLAELRGGAAR